MEGNAAIFPRVGPSRLWRLVLRAGLYACGGLAAAFLLAIVFARPATAQTADQPGATNTGLAGPISVVTQPAADVVSQVASDAAASVPAASGTAGTSQPAAQPSQADQSTTGGVVSAVTGTVSQAASGTASAVTGTVTQAASGTASAVTGTGQPRPPRAPRTP